MIHSYFRSIGFSELSQNVELYKILEEVVNHPDEQTIDEDPYGNEFACFSKYLGENMGITVCGNFMNDDEFRMEYYYPYFHGSNITTSEPVEIERHSSQESYIGICDELKLGLPLIFYITNVMDVLREKKFSRGQVRANNIVISGLAYSGKILFPTAKTPQIAAIKQKSSRKRMNLMQQARDGSRSAMENLTLNDMDMYASVSRRVMKEDILTIVESSIIPYGVESDQYTIIGEILNFYQIENQVSGENVWIMTLLCNDLKFDICINTRHLIGEPEIGRRFRGRIWMQGFLNFGY